MQHGKNPFNLQASHVDYFPITNPNHLMYQKISDYNKSIDEMVSNLLLSNTGIICFKQSQSSLLTSDESE